MFSLLDSYSRQDDPLMEIITELLSKRAVGQACQQFCSMPEAVRISESICNRHLWSKHLS